MLTEEENKFIEYWETQRLRKKQYLKKLSIGLPLGVLIASALLINFLSGWYKKADMQLHGHSSVILVVLLAVIGIVIFITVFSARHKWEQNEMQYQEFLKKNKK